MPEEPFAQEVRDVERALAQLRAQLEPLAEPPAPAPATAATGSAVAVDELVSITNALRERFERDLAATEARLRAEAAAERDAQQAEIESMRARLEDLRQQLGVLAGELQERLERERAARWAAEAELAQEREARAADRTALAELRAELERRPLAPAGVTQPAVPAPRPPVSPAARAPAPPAPVAPAPPDLAADLDRAAERLRAQPVAPEQAVVVAASAPPTAARGQGGWLQAALSRLHHDDPPAAARMAVALLPVLGRRVTKPGTIDVSVSGSGTYRVLTGPLSGPVSSAPPVHHGQAEVTVRGDAATLAPLLAGGARWRLPGAQVDGRRGRLLRALRAMRRPVGLAEAAAAGAALEPELMLTALVSAIEPAWTKGHRFTVAFVVPGGEDLAWHVRVADGAPLVVTAGLPAEEATATLEALPAAMQSLLGGETPHLTGADPRITGNPHAMTLLGEWMDRAQGLTR